MALLDCCCCVIPPSLLAVISPLLLAVIFPLLSLSFPLSLLSFCPSSSLSFSPFSPCCSLSPRCRITPPSSLSCPLSCSSLLPSSSSFPPSSSSLPPFLALCHPPDSLASGSPHRRCRIRLTVIGFTWLARIVTDFLWGLTSLVWVEKREGWKKRVMTSVVRFPPLTSPSPPHLNSSLLVNLPSSIPPSVFSTSSSSISPSSSSTPSSSSSPLPPRCRSVSYASYFLDPTSPISSLAAPSSEYEPAHIPLERGGAAGAATSLLRELRLCWLSPHPSEEGRGTWPYCCVWLGWI